MYGCKIIRPNGAVWMSPNVTPLIFQGKRTVSLSGGTVLDTGFPPDRSPLIFIAYNHLTPLLATRIVQNNRIAYSFGGPGRDDNATIYTFATGVAKTEKWGMSFRNSAGVEIYNSACLPLTFEFLDRQKAVDSGTYEYSYPVAIMPSYAHVVNAPMPGGATTIVFGFSCTGNQITTVVVTQSYNGSSATLNSQLPVLNRSLYD